MKGTKGERSGRHNWRFKWLKRGKLENGLEEIESSEFCSIGHCN